MELFLELSYQILFDALYWVIIATLVVGCSAVLGILLWFLFQKRRKPKKQEGFEATVVADLISVVLLRDEAGKLYSLHRPFVGDVYEGYVIMIRPVRNGVPDLLGYETKLSWNVYGISEKGKAKRAKVIRRLNKEFALCELDKKYILVRCSAEEQMKAEVHATMVSGLKRLENDMQILQTEEVSLLSVEVIAGIASFQECVRV